MKSGKYLKRFLSYYKPYLFLFYFDLFCAFVVAAADVVFPQAVRYLCRKIPEIQSTAQTAAVQNAQIIRLAVIIALILSGLYAAKYFAQYFITAQGHVMGAKMERDMRNDLFNHLQKLSFSYYDNHNTGDMISRIVSDLFDISELAHHGPENLFIAFIKITGSFALLMFINIELTCILAFVTVLLTVFSVLSNVKMRKVFALNRKTISGVNSQVQDSLLGIRVVQSFANEEFESRKFGEANERFVRSKDLNYTQMGKFFAGNSLLQGVFFIVTVLAGCRLIVNNALSITDFTVYVLYINVYIAPINLLLNFTETFQKGAAGFKRFAEIIETEPAVTERPDAQVLCAPAGNIKYTDVSFSYGGAKVLNNVSINFPAGKVTALAGPSGGGKTTICSLLPRFYDVTSGSITIDGKDIRGFTLKSLRSNIGIVQQDVYLFSGTIRENIAYGKNDGEASSEQIIEAAKKAHIHDFIMTLPNGYDSYVGERGVRLSGGQKQRISIARVFLKNPPILILDEATSSLDAENELLIQKAIESLSENRTTIVIAHRLSTIRNADTIIVITDEGIAETGTHEELLSKNGIYAKLRRLNASI